MTQDTKEQKEATDPVAAIRENLNSAKERLMDEDVSESTLISDLKDELTDSSDSTASSDTTSISIDPNIVPTTTPALSDDPQASDADQKSDDDSG